MSWSTRESIPLGHSVWCWVKITDESGSRVMTKPQKVMRYGGGGWKMCTDIGLHMTMDDQTHKIWVIDKPSEDK